jgi:hypothetical protein
MTDNNKKQWENEANRYHITDDEIQVVNIKTNEIVFSSKHDD